MIISTKEEIKQALNEVYESYRDNQIEDGDYKLESDSVAYGDTYVSSGSYLSERDEERIFELFIEELEDENGIVASIILDGYLGEDITDENRAELLKVAKEGF